jgi:hypothetical protein
VDVEEPGTNFVNGPDYIGAGANGVAHVKAAAHPWVHILYNFQNI